MKSSKKLGFGIVGVGAIGKVHAQNLAGNVPRATLVGIADAYIEVAKKVGESLGIENIYSDYRKLLEDKDVDAIVVATPPFVKREIVVAAAESGKHVFVEKPMALSLEDADEMISRSSKAGIKLQIGYQRRFDAAFVRAEKSIASGEIGKILLVKSFTRDPPGNPQGWTTDPKMSGGIMLDTCSHDFDAIRFLTKSEVTSVYAAGVNLIYPQLKTHGEVDNVVVTLRLANGALAYVDSCQYTVYGYDIAAEVLGMKGAVHIGIGRNSAVKVLGKETEFTDYPQTFQERFGQAYRDELVDFCNCILENREPRVTGKDGRAAIEIGLAARLSMSKDAPVSLSA
ncbi:MAG TPA: Gfo/Idh/MocA family oxidoreductase [Nitrososphaerales archaeon]|nr:Gfo/Idh/MocA family oxidoreductase [Nitrososphaerales archaeon]